MVFGLISCSNEKELSHDELLFKAKKNIEQSKFEEALILTNKAISINNDDTSCDALLTHALALELSKDITGALTTLRKAVKANPNSFLAQFNLGRLLYDSENYGDCIAPLIDAEKIKPNYTDTIVLLAQTYAKMELYDNAIRYYKRLLKNDKYKSSPEAWNELGVLYLHKNSKKNALLCFKKSIQLDSNNYISTFNIATMLENIKPRYAIHYYKKYIELVKNNPELIDKKNSVLARLEELSPNDK